MKVTNKNYVTDLRRLPLPDSSKLTRLVPPPATSDSSIPLNNNNTIGGGKDLTLNCGANAIQQYWSHPEANLRWYIPLVCEHCSLKTLWQSELELQPLCFSKNKEFRHAIGQIFELPDIHTTTREVFFQIHGIFCKNPHKEWVGNNCTTDTLREHFQIGGKKNPTTGFEMHLPCYDENRRLVPKKLIQMSMRRQELFFFPGSIFVQSNLPLGRYFREAFRT